MGEPGEGILGRDGLDRQTHCLPECLLGAGAEPTQEGLDLGKRLFNRGEIGRVRRQEEELAVAGFQSLANAGRFVDAQIIQHDNLPRLERWRELLGDVPDKRVRIHGSLNHPGHLQASRRERRDQRRVRTVVARD